MLNINIDLNHKNFSKNNNYIMSYNSKKQDHQNIAQAPLPIRKLYQVAMEQRLEQMCVEQYIEECDNFRVGRSD